MIDFKYTKDKNKCKHEFKFRIMWFVMRQAPEPCHYDGGYELWCKCTECGEQYTQGEFFKEFKESILRGYPDPAYLQRELTRANESIRLLEVLLASERKALNKVTYRIFKFKSIFDGIETLFLKQPRAKPKKEKAKWR